MADEIEASNQGNAPVPPPIAAPTPLPPVVAGSGGFDRDDESPEIPATIVLATSILTGACIIFAMILCVIVIRGAMDDHPSELTIRLLTSCIACFVGMAFASLGFGLFLLRARGRFRAQIDDGNGGGTARPALIESTAPGLIVIVCATIVIWLSLRVHFEETTTTRSAAFAPASGPPAGPAPTVSQPLTLLHKQDGVPPP